MESSNSGVFRELKIWCLELLQLAQTPKKNSPALSQLLLLLRSSPPPSLQPLFDYVLFPLLLLLDSAVSCRSSQNSPSQPNFINDAVAEPVLHCLQELLSKCHLASVNQLTVLIKKLTYGAMLSATEASEEFRGGVVKCFRTLLINLSPCLQTSCSCKHSLAKPELLDTTHSKALTAQHSTYHCQPPDCLIAFLQSQSASAALGHWLSLLLNIADAEVGRGLRGSAKLRVEALITVRVLVAKVGIPDALAFFLPGVVSQLAKVLHVSKSMISGAAGSTEATEHAIRGLAEFLTIVLQDDADAFDLHMSNELLDLNSHEFGSSQSYLEKLRHLHDKAQDPRHTSGDSSGINVISNQDLSAKQLRKAGGGVGPLYVKRTPEWIERATNNVDKLLSNTFPHLCTHPSKRVRHGLLSAVQGLLSNCNNVLNGSRLMLLECLCTLVCDDSREVCTAAQDFLGCLFVSHGKLTVQADIAELFNRLLERLPKVVLGSEESVALASAQQMLAVIYYSGPQLIMDHLLCFPVKAAKLFDVFALCLSQESVFAGSLGKLVLSTPSATGYLHSLTELRDGSKNAISEHSVVRSKRSEESSMNALVKEMKQPCNDYELPRMPPWFVHVGSSKLYRVLAGILRLVGLSLIVDCRNEVTLLQIVEIPLGFLRKLVADFRKKGSSKESWESWYARSQSGQLLRQASTAACILNEMLFGMSDQAIDVVKDIFTVSVLKDEEKQNSDGFPFNHFPAKSYWNVTQTPCVRQHVIDCVGIILHEFMSPEVWDVPVAPLVQSGKKTENINMHFFRDVAMLHEVLIDGIGVFSICLGKNFVSSGFLCSSLYLLLENLICSNSEVRHAADAVLRVISATSGYPTAGHLVVANADYVIDSLCHQLRHLDLNPQVPNVLASMLSFVGVAHKILPLLEEPMRCVSMELEILGRHQHPELTIPFLKAVEEIAKAAKHEADGLPSQSESYLVAVNAKASDVKIKLRRDDLISGESDDGFFGDVSMEEWESILFQLNDNKRYRRIVASIAASCLTAVIPLVASMKEPICLIALDIIEHGIMTLAKVEEAFAHEKETKEAIIEVASLCSFYNLNDILDAAEEGADENRLLPAMNQIWPYLVACVRNKIPLPVRRCVEVVSKVVRICGGNFFTRRFHTDGSHFWKLLTTSPFTRKSIRNNEASPLLLPYRSTSRTSEDPVSESSNLQTQKGVLHMIANLSHDKRSSTALDIALKKVCGLVVGVACSGVVGLHDASIDALSGLATMDPDLVWLLLADVYYSFKGRDIIPPPVFPDLAQVMPPPLSSKDYLFVQYGGQTYGFDINFSSVEIVFKKLYPEMFMLP
ncbi:uncharacterized protein LOC141638053 [Silene latifolia]|uniref:uncharacterized protein LOC141638053 n=1 Tax=Silene latifolia TaxID=37657 RepID=UPI003D76BA4E